MKYLLIFLADWANGIFAVYLASLLTGTDLVWWHYLVGIVLSHWPDLDALPELFRKGKVGASGENAKDHRDGLHYPLIVLPITLILALILGYWGWVFFIVTFMHFVNDMYGTGWGVKLFWPLNTNSYKICGRRVNRLKSVLVEDGDWDSLSQDERKLRLRVSWTEAELPGYMSKWGMDDWIDKIYLRSSWLVIVEYTLFAVAVLIVFFTLL